MKKGLTLGLTFVFLVFMVIVTTSLEQSRDSDYEPATEAQSRSDQRSRSILDSLRHVRQVSQSSAGFNRRPARHVDASECGIPRQVTENIRLDFAGYELEFPCTAGGNGFIRAEPREDGREYQHHTLYLGVHIWNGDETIWGDGNIDNDIESSERFVLVLRSDGEPKTSPFLTGIDQYRFIRNVSESNMDVYIKNDSTIAVGVLSSNTDATGQHPRVSCPLSDRYDAEDIFTPSLEIEYAARPCGAGWNLTDDITISILRLRPGLASEFGRVFQTINPEIQKIIKRRPETTSE